MSITSTGRVFNILTVPPNDQETATQTLIYNAGTCALWLDPSDTTCTAVSAAGSNAFTTKMVEKTVSALFNYTNFNGSGGWNFDTTHFLPPAGLFTHAGFWSTTGDPVNAGAMQIADATGVATLFFTGYYAPGFTSAETTYLTANLASGAPTYNTTAETIQLTRTGERTFTLSVIDSDGNTLTSSAFTLPNNTFQLTVILGRNGSNNPTLVIRAESTQVYAYDPGSSNPTGLNFNGGATNAFGIDADGTIGTFSLGEMVAYQGAISGSSITAIESYLQTKWEKIVYTVTINDLAADVGIINARLNTTIEILHAHTVTLSFTAVNAVSGWTITAPTDGSNNWNLSGVFPASVTNFMMHVHAVDISGTQTADKSFVMTTTRAGSITDEQYLVYELNPAVWLDPSDATCVTADPTSGRVSYVMEKTSTAGFTVSSSETPIRDTTSFAVDGIAFSKDSEASNGFNYSIALDFSTRPDLHVVDVTQFNQPFSHSSLPQGNGFVVTAEDGSFTFFQILRYNGLPSGTPLAAMRLKNDMPDNAAGAVSVNEWGVTTSNVGSDDATGYQVDGNSTYEGPADPNMPTGPNNPTGTASLDYQAAVGQMAPNMSILMTWRNAPIITTSNGGVTNLPSIGDEVGWAGSARGTGDNEPTQGTDDVFDLVKFLIPFDVNYNTSGNATHMTVHDVSEFTANYAALNSYQFIGQYHLGDTPWPGLGTGSIGFTGVAGSTLALPLSTTLYDWADGDFTIEFWIKAPVEQLVDNPVIFSMFPNGGTPTGVEAMVIYLATAGSNHPAVVVTNTGPTPILTTNQILADNNWHHFAIACYQGSWNMFIDGEQIASAYQGPVVTPGANMQAFIGGTDALTTTNNAYMQIVDFRYTKGWARYNFAYYDFTQSPFIAPMPTHGRQVSSGPAGDPYYSDVAFLIPFASDDGGNAPYAEFSDFSPANWDLSAHPGTMTLDTSNQLFGQPTALFDPTDPASLPLDLPYSTVIYGFGTDDFTVEAWVNGPPPNQQDPYAELFSMGPRLVEDSEGINANTFSVNLVASDIGRNLGVSIGNFSTSAMFLSSGVTPLDNTWHHVAVVRASGVIHIYLDGVLTASQAWAGQILPLGIEALGRIGGHDGGRNLNRFHGNISNFRVTHMARYTGAFDPPTAPFSTQQGSLTGTYGGPEIRINGVDVTTSWFSGSAPDFTAALAKFTQIYGNQSLGPVGETILVPSYLSDIQTGAVEQHLMTKWFINAGAPPTISAPNPDHQYCSHAYVGYVTITNGSNDPVTASVSASAGTGWALTQDGTIPHRWNLTGTMPATAEAVTLTFTATQSQSTTVTPYDIQAVALPLAPVIEQLAPLSAPINYAYVGKVVILNVRGANVNDLGVTVVANAGSNWTIEVDPAGAQYTYEVQGTMPGVLTNFNLTITAVDVSVDNVVSATAQRTFVMQSTGDASIIPTQYPLDLTGMLASNLIRGELQTLTPDNGADNQFLVPILAPFYMTNILVQYEDPLNGDNLITALPGIDYVPVGELQTLSRACVSPVYTALSFMNLKVKGTIHLQYQTLGGNFVLDRRKIYESLTDKIVNEKEVEWNHVVDLPTYFPVAPHDHDAENDLVGMAGMVSALTDVETAYEANSESGDLAGMAAHIARRDNPHRVTADQVNRGLVPNFPVATDAQAVDPTNATTLLTPHGAAKAAQAGIPQATASVAGIAELNLGNKTGDDNNATDALTAGGLLALINAPQANQIQQNFTSGETVAQISPFPMQFPLYWQGIAYNNLASFISAVESAVGVQPIPFNAITGEMYFPHGVVVPSLLTTTTSTSTGTRPGTTEDTMNLPMYVPT